MSPFIKVSSLVFLITTSILFTACSSDENTDDAKKKVENVATASGIQVTTNDDAKAIKVAVKDSGTKDSSYYLDYGKKSQKAQVKERTNLDANLHVRSPYETVQVSMITNKLSKKFIVKCSACHSDYANGIIGPSLLGKDSDFIYGKIMKFKADKTLNVLMSDLVSNMSNDEVREMADEIYKFNQQIKKMRNK